jgi:hypothetical protein
MQSVDVTSRRSHIIAIAIFWLFLSAVTAFGLGSINIPKFQELNRNGISTSGTVVSTDCLNHNSVYYNYAVQGHTYSGRTTLTRCLQLKIGDDLVVYYSSRFPSLNDARNPRDALFGEYMSVGMATLFVPPTIILMIYLQRHRIRRFFGAS